MFFIIDLDTDFAYTKDRRTGDILLVRLTPKIRYQSRTYEPERWRTTEKSDIKAGHIGRSVGGQQKNQSVRERSNAAVL